MTSLVGSKVSVTVLSTSCPLVQRSIAQASPDEILKARSERILYTLAKDYTTRGRSGLLIEHQIKRPGIGTTGNLAKGLNLSRAPRQRRT